MTWTIDTAHTSVGFSAKHLGLSTVRGQFTSFRGDVDIPDSGDLTKATGRVVIDTASIDTGNPQRDGHLRAGDFFNTEAYPEMVFDLRGVEAAGEDRYRVTGDLTLLGVTRPVTLDFEHNGIVVDPFGNTKLGGTLTGTINRSDWGLKWNVPLGGGGLLVSEKVKIEVDGQLAKSKEAVAEEVAQETAPASA
ncbi:MAG TPA: YceI family protein [Candidatus Dormibacteraeota bacterium]|nr:YceI family protein [Candidatus Dormibacteraeota bacterium]